MTEATHDQEPHAEQPEQPETVDEAREQIDRTREELGETIHAIAGKTDVKAQVRRKADEAKARVSEKTASLHRSVADGSPGESDPVDAVKQAAEKIVEAVGANPTAALVIALAVGLLLGRLTKRRRRRS